MVEPLTFEPFQPSALAGWLAHTRAGYVNQRVAAGDSPAESEANASSNLERLFPDGAPAPGQLAGSLTTSGQVVGSLWIGIAGSDPERWWVWDVEIDETFRGRGYGRHAMLLAETLARGEGARTIGLNVFGHNRVARSLYDSLGYEEAAVQMRKDL
jgi:ribosomal protein S18 acetylase RimI-like enzyme